MQNATLAGGVAIGTASNMSISPWGALLIGCCAGALSTVGYAYVTVSKQDLSPKNVFDNYNHTTCLSSHHGHELKCYQLSDSSVTDTLPALLYNSPRGLAILRLQTVSYFVLEFVGWHANAAKGSKGASSICALNHLRSHYFSSCSFCSIVFFKVLSAVVRLKSLQNL